MVHDKARVQNIRARAQSQLQRIEALQAKIVKGELDALRVARFQTDDIESFFLQDLERRERTASEEAFWLSGAEKMLQVWTPFLDRTEEQFKKYGDRGIQIVG
jgi:hypothetical protein